LITTKQEGAEEIPAVVVELKWQNFAQSYAKGTQCPHQVRAQSAQLTQRYGYWITATPTKPLEVISATVAIVALGALVMIHKKSIERYAIYPLT